jgi:cyclophilin family peptidyl-prolyl cis-trans isomerase
MPSHRRRIRRSKKSRKPILIVGFLVAVAAIAIAAYVVMNSSGSSGPTVLSKNTVLLSTSMGSITIQLRDDMPITTTNFKNLVQQGKYDGTIFHRVIAGFMIQGGQLNSSWPSIQDEFGSNNHNVRGTIAMAKTSEPNSASSQFFINVVDNSNPSFDSTYSVFGDVTQGMDVVDAISQVPVIPDPNTGENSRPAQDVTIITAQLLD